MEDPTPPDPPQWVQKSLPEEWPERGIDAHESGGIFLEWEPAAAAENILTYHIYRAVYDDTRDSLDDFETLVSLYVDSNPSNNYIDKSIELNVRYEYLLKSEDNAGNLSDFSDTSGYALMRSVPTEYMLPNGLSVELGSKRELSWYYSYHIAMENYCLTLRNSDNQLILRQAFSPGNYVGDWESWAIPDSITLFPGNLYQWRVDMHGNYKEDRERTGSESTWAWFLYPTP